MATAVAVRRVEQRPLTHRDLDDLPEEEGIRYEVIDGELYMSSFPFLPHQRAASRLLIIVGSYLENHPIGEVFTSGTKVVLDEPTGVGPDLVYIAKEHLQGLRRDGFYGAPDLVVEVTSSKPGLDRVIKYRKYASAGIRNYWIIDPDERTLEVFELEGDEYVLRKTAHDEETLSSSIFPGLQIQLARLWR
jgi:Uma2 family endonuclease